MVLSNQATMEGYVGSEASVGGKTLLRKTAKVGTDLSTS